MGVLHGRYVAIHRAFEAYSLRHTGKPPLEPGATITGNGGDGINEVGSGPIFVLRADSVYKVRRTLRQIFDDWGKQDAAVVRLH